MKRHVPAARFKAECLALLNQVAETRQPLVVTKHGRPVAEVVPVPAAKGRSLRGSVTVRGDIVAPVLESWDIDR